MTRSAGTARPRLADPARTPARTFRGLLVGLLTGAGAYVAHQLSGGQATVGVGVVVTLLAVGVGIAVARRRVAVGMALGLAVAAQATSHLLLVGGSGVEHLDHPHLAADSAGHSGLSMLLTHASVALVTALLSRRTDQVVLDLLRTLVAWFLPRTWLPRLPLATTRTAHVIDDRLLPAALRAVTPVTRRGPPVALLLSPTTP